MPILETLVGGGIFGLFGKVVDRIWPDANQAQEIKLKLFQAEQEGFFKELDTELQRDLAQAKVNEEDAKSGRPFQANWRPFIGWVCGVSLALAYIPKALVITYMWSYQAWVLVHAWNGVGSVLLPTFPDLGLTDVLGLLGGMIGLGSLRTAEKIRGVAK